MLIPAAPSQDLLHVGAAIWDLLLTGVDMMDHFPRAFHAYEADGQHISQIEDDSGFFYHDASYPNSCNYIIPCPFRPTISSSAFRRGISSAPFNQPEFDPVLTSGETSETLVADIATAEHSRVVAGRLHPGREIHNSAIILSK